MIMNGNRPTLISGVPKPALSLATIRSQASAIPSEPARTWPLAATIEGLPSSPSSTEDLRERPVPKNLSAVGASAAEAAEVAAGREDLLVRGGEHDDAHGVVGLRRAQRLEQLAQQLIGERVARLRVVEGDRGDAASATS